MRVLLLTTLLAALAHAITSRWIECSAEGEYCHLASEPHVVRFGTDNASAPLWADMLVPPPGVMCTAGKFGFDPAPGSAKQCQIGALSSDLPANVQSPTDIVGWRVSDEFQCRHHDHKVALVGVVMPVAARARRRLIRATYLRFRPPDIAVYFVCCYPRANDNMRALRDEMAQFDDIVVMSCVENGNDGKTWDWFAYAYTHFCAAHFVVKADDDTFIHLTNLRNDLVAQRPRDVYYGRFCTPAHQIMCGALYALSWNLVQFVVTDSRVRAHRYENNAEDYATFQWVELYGNASLVTRSVAQFHDHPLEAWTGWSAPFSNASIAIHQCKVDEHMRDASEFFFGVDGRVNEDMY